MVEVSAFGVKMRVSVLQALRKQEAAVQITQVRKLRDAVAVVAGGVGAIAPIHAPNPAQKALPDQATVAVVQVMNITTDVILAIQIPTQIYAVM